MTWAIQRVVRPHASKVGPTDEVIDAGAHDGVAIDRGRRDDRRGARAP